MGLLFDRFEGYRHYELLLVMIAVPFVMNIIQFWIQDTFLKKDMTVEYSRLPQTTSEEYIDAHVGDGDILLPGLKVTKPRENGTSPPKSPPNSPHREGKRY